MTDPPSSSTTSVSWGVSGQDASELMRSLREQLLMYENLSPESQQGMTAQARPSEQLTLDDVAEDVRELMVQYERSRPGVRLTPLRYITIAGPDGVTVAGSADLPDDGLVSIITTRTIAEAGRVEVTSRILVASAAGTGTRSS
jgi:hypothetical protein